MDEFFVDIAPAITKPTSRYAGPKGWESREKSLQLSLQLPVGLLILMALAEGPAYGTQLARRIIGDTMGRLVERSTLYDELARLEQRELVKRGPAGWKRRIEITQKGESRLMLSVQELQLALEVAKKRQLC